MSIHEPYIRDVDTLASELSVSGEIDTATASSPQTVLTPTSGRKLDTRAIYLATDSSSGEVSAVFPTSNILLGKLYCNKFTMVTLGNIRITGQANEPIQISWSGTDSGAKIFYVIRYKEV